MTGDLDIVDDLVLSGAGQNVVTIDAGGLTGGNSDRVFHVLSGVTATIDGVTVTGGAPDGASSFHRNGGGVFNDGTLEIENTTITANTAATLLPVRTVPVRFVAYRRS